MPANPPRIYTCPSRLTRAGFDLTALDADVVWDLIVNVSMQIDTLTQQWFNGESGTWTFSGNGSRVLQHRSRIPIQQITQIDIASATTRINENMPSTWWWPDWDWQVESVLSWLGGEVTSLTEADNHFRAHASRRSVERVFGTFPSGVSNVGLVGVLGYVDPFKAVATTTVAEVTSNTAEIEVVDASEFEARDVIEIIGTDTVARLMVVSVDYATDTLTVDPGTATLLERDIEADVVLRTWGKVPLPIEKLAHFLYASAVMEYGAFGAGEVPLDPSRIRRERTDDYEYEMFPATGQGVSGGLTGSPKYDVIVRRYSAPAYMAFSGK